MRCRLAASTDKATVFDRTVQGDSEVASVLRSIRWTLKCLRSTRSSSSERLGPRRIGNENVSTVSRRRHVNNKGLYTWSKRRSFSASTISAVSRLVRPAKNALFSALSQARASSA